MTNRFIVLHLSDLHLGNPKSKLNARLVVGPLYDDLAAMRERYGLNPDLIVFSGDLAHGEVQERPLRAQYGEECRAFLERICSVFGKDIRDQPLLIIPGNHDIDRTQIVESQTAWLLRQEEAPSGADVVSEAMRVNSEEWQRFLRRQEAWQEFVLSLELPGWTFHPTLNVSTRIFETATRRIGVCGFNSAWSAGGEHDKGRLWLGRHQIELALSDLETADFRIGVTHHSTDWLNESEGPIATRLLDQHFNVLMHGHEHNYFVKDAGKHLTLAAAAAYQGSTGDNGYGWLDLDFTERTASVVLRQFREDDGKAWHARVGDKTDADGRAQILFPEETAPPDDGVMIKPELTMWERVKRLRPGGALGDVERAIRDLEDQRFAVWEPGSFEPIDEPPVIFWPLRLRHPTPIHAAQCFVVAALQRGGANVQLWIDDLGDQPFGKYGVEDFRKRLEKWILACGGASPEIRRYSDIAATEETLAGWETVRSWWGGDVTLDDVLLITKLHTPTPEHPRARKLLTPAMTWSCLMSTVRETAATSLITLGGNDERPFWAAWSRARSDGTLGAGHLYIPQLSPPRRDEALHMDTDRLAWRSRTDVRDFLRSEASDDGTLASDWHKPSRPIPWCATCCVDLPLHVTGMGASGLARLMQEVEHGQNGPEAAEGLIAAVSEAVAEILFGSALQDASSDEGGDV